MARIYEDNSRSLSRRTIGGKCADSLEYAISSGPQVLWRKFENSRPARFIVTPVQNAAHGRFLKPEHRSPVGGPPMDRRDAPMRRPTPQQEACFSARRRSAAVFSRPKSADRTGHRADALVSRAGAFAVSYCSGQHQAPRQDHLGMCIRSGVTEVCRRTAS